MEYFCYETSHIPLRKSLGSSRRRQRILLTLIHGVLFMVIFLVVVIANS